MGKVRFTFLYISLFLTFTQGMWERLFFFNPAIDFVVEFSAVFFILISLNRVLYKTPVLYYFLIFIIFSLLSSVVNDSSLLMWLKHIRYTTYFYLIYAVFWSTYISVEQWRRLIKFIVFLILMQGAGAFFNLFVLNIRVEGYVGLMSSLGGTTATTFPLFIISLVSVVYLFSQNKNRYFKLVLILIVLSCAFVGYASMKRAIYFSIPMFLVLSMLISFHYLETKSDIIRKAGILILLFIIALPVFIFGIRNSGGINSGLTGNENNSQVIRGAFNFAQTYTKSRTESGYSAGRIATTFNIFNRFSEDPKSLLFGANYGVHKTKKGRNSLKFVYGLVGFTRDIISGGVILALLTVLVIARIILINHSTKFKITKALRIIIFLIFIFIHFNYSSDFTVHLKITFVLAILCALMNSPVHKEVLNSLVSRYLAAI